MAVYITTTQPNGLLTAIKNAIDAGDIETWSYDDGGDFTHTPNQWRGAAWLRPAIENGRLALYIFPNTSGPLGRETYAVYHGRFIEMVAAHFDKMFTQGCATAMPVAGKDKLGAPAAAVR